MFAFIGMLINKQSLHIKKPKPFGVSAVVVDDAEVVDVSSVELENISSMHRLSPEIQSSQDSSTFGQFWKSTHSVADVKKVNHRHPRVESQS